MDEPRGCVYLVGAGPGDPELITVRGLKLLRTADVVVHDRLVSSELLGEAPPHAEIIDAGKKPGCQKMPQRRVELTLIDRARRNLRVVRLKGGDPFVFGRGFEELRACREAGVRCDVVPGVSSAIAGPAAAGIPVTLRQAVRSVGLVTGHFCDDPATPPIDYAALRSMDTVVLLMGLRMLPEFAASLIEAGRDPHTPAACIQWATTPQQQVVCGTLGSIAEEAGRAGLTSPVVTVIGEVAAFASP